MEPITYINRETGLQEVEKVYGEKALRFLYGNTLFSRWFGAPLVFLLSKIPFFSAAYGALQKSSYSQKKIKPFIDEFEVDPSDFLEEVGEFKTFNDFFIRKLKPEARPIVPGPNIAIIPADGRYLFYPHIEESDGFVVKGKKFQLSDLLEDVILASKYAQGTMVMARLCPSDYHRFHFPCDCIPGESKFINGWLYSVNPIAIKRDVTIFTQNKRTLCELKTKDFGDVLYLEIGATNVGTIHETYTPFLPHPKGSEKGYFSFGGSSLILLFEPGKLVLDSDLTAHPHQEIRCLMGQSMGRAQN